MVADWAITKERKKSEAERMKRRERAGARRKELSLPSAEMVEAPEHFCPQKRWRGRGKELPLAQCDLPHSSLKCLERKRHSDSLPLYVITRN